MGKRSLILATVLFITIVIVMWQVSFQRIDLYHKNVSLVENLKAENRLEDSKLRLQELYAISKEHVLFIADLMEPNFAKDVDSNFSIPILTSFLKTHKNYFQARFIEPSGGEVIRIQNSEVGLFEIERSKIPENNERHYFQKSIKLNKGEVFVSYLDLNIENGMIEVPYRPTIRFFTPIYVNNELRGVAGLNLEAKNWLENFHVENIHILNSKNELFYGGEDEQYKVTDIDLQQKNRAGNYRYLSQKISLEGGGHWTIYTSPDLEVIDNQTESYRKRIYWTSSILSLGLLVFLIITYILYDRNRKISVLNRTVETSLQERNILLKEIHHRVKNNMQVVASLLSLQSSFIEDENIKGILRYSQYRINSMAIVHEMLYGSDNLSRINYGEYLQTLVSTLMLSMKGNQSGIEMRIDAEDLFLNLDTSIPLGLMINEIVTNSLKYGFKDKEVGNLSIEVKKLKYPNFCIKIGDNGHGLPPDVNFRNTKSLGLKLIHKLALQLKGNIEMDNSKVGTHYIITFQEIEQTS